MNFRQKRWYADNGAPIQHHLNTEIVLQPLHPIAETNLPNEIFSRTEPEKTAVFVPTAEYAWSAVRMGLLREPAQPYPTLNVSL